MKNLLSIIAITFLSISVMAQKPNFSGEWTLNKDKSELGYEFSLAPKALTVEHTKKTLDMTNYSEWEGQEVEIKTHYTLDGEICENTGFMDSVTKSTASFDKKARTITIETDGSAGGYDYSITQILSMKDGQLVVEMEAASDMGEMAETFVFDKK